jgi:outer membrane protein assembly factor BamD
MAKENALEQFKYAAEFEQAGQWELAVREYRKVVRFFPDSILAPRAQFKVGESYERLGKLSKAFDQYQLVLDKYPSFSDPEEVIKRQFAIASAFYGGRKKAMPLMGFRILSGKAEAIRLYEQLALNAPFSPMAEESKFRAGELLERKKHYDDYTTMGKGTHTGAINTYLFVVDNFDEGARRDDALYRVGECYYKKARRARYDKKAIEQALLYYRRSQREYPKGEHVEAVTQRIAELDHRRAEGLFEVARYYERRGKYRAALLYYDDLAKSFPLSPYAEQAEERAGTLRQRVTPGEDKLTKDPGEDVIGPEEINQ